jgi:hypothetical protein
MAGLLGRVKRDLAVFHSGQLATFDFQLAIATGGFTGANQFHGGRTDIVDVTPLRR